MGINYDIDVKGKSAYKVYPKEKIKGDRYFLVCVMSDNKEAIKGTLCPPSEYRARTRSRRISVVYITLGYGIINRFLLTVDA